jgi:signal transduction histidine kinase
MNPSRVFRTKALAFFMLCGVAAGGSKAVEEPGSEVLTNLMQLRRLGDKEKRHVCSFHLEGVVCAVDEAAGNLFMADQSSAAVIEMDWGSEPVRPGRQIVVEGTNCGVARTAMGLRLGKGPVVDLDGSHPPLRGSGGVYLKAGRQPIRVVWFNDILGSALELSYEGPGVPLQRVPSSALSHLENDPAGGTTQFATGLAYRCFEGPWNRLPDFSKLSPVKSGTAANIDYRLRSRNEHVGLEFTGFLTLQKEGLYTFHLYSDDGGQLFMPETLPRVKILDSAPLPTPRPTAIGQALSADGEDFQWSEVEGELTLTAKRGDGAELELRSGHNPLRVKIMGHPEDPPTYLTHGRLRAVGICQGTFAAEGQILAGALLVPDWGHIQVLDAAPEIWRSFPSVKLSDLQRTNLAGYCVRASGRLDAVAGDGHIVLADETGEAQVELLMEMAQSDESGVEVLGVVQGSGKDVALTRAIYRPRGSGKSTEGLPVLTTAAQVQRLNREEAARGYPVKIRGVVPFVSANLSSLVVQDSTRAIFVTYYPRGWGTDLPQPGDYWEVEGTSNPADFSPIIQVKQATRLGLGRLPEPVRPTWDQLINGSLDAQYVELQGIVTAVRDDRLTLLTPVDKINVTLTFSGVRPQSDFSAKSPGSVENALVRIRGCLFAEWDSATHRVRINRGIRIGNATVTVDAPAPLNLFDAPKKSAAELMFFDALASALQRVKVAGQIIHERDGTCYVMDGTNGVRFQAKETVAFEPGDRVEAVGFPVLGGASPLLREAVARKTGRAALPAPRLLPPKDLMQEEADSTLVRIEGALLNVRETRTEQVLELQNGLRTFAARLQPKVKTLRSLETGSRLELTGVYAGQGGSRPEGREVSAFELLLNSASDVRVMARPPWWTLKRLLAVIGILVGVLTLAAIWISLLRRQVEKRTDQLQHQIRERERAEHARAIEEERTRIARDLHDDLGSSLTEISMLATRGPGTEMRTDEASRRLERIAGKSRGMISALDELVWAVNPRNDTLPSLCKYLASYTEEFLSTLDVMNRVQSPHSLPNWPIPAEARHSLLLAVKEILNNAVRHGHASEVLFRLAFLEDGLEILIKDNGRGFDPATNHSGNGLTNIRDRMRQLNGRCEVDSSPGTGTTVALRLPINAAGDSNSVPGATAANATARSD